MLSTGQGLVLFAIYGVFILILVWSTRHRSPDVSDFLLMGRQLGVLRGAFSIAVSWIWAPAVFICAQQAYTQGLPGIFWFTAPNILTFFVFVPIGLKMRQVLPEGFTVSQLFKHTFDGDARPHAAALTVAFGYQLGAIVINCVAGATLIEILSGIPYHVGVLLMGSLTLAYSLISGLRASVMSDIAQMLMILVFALFLVPWVVIESGGISVVNAGLGGVSGNFRNVLDPAIAFSFGVATSIGLIAGPVADQMFSQRVFAAKRDAVARIFIIGGLLFGLVPITLSVLGFVGAGAVQTGVALSVTDPQMIGPAVVGHFLPPMALMLFAILAFAGLTSTLDSAFAAVGSLWAIDLARFRTTPTPSVAAARLGMVVFTAVGVAIAMLRPQLLWVFLVYGALAASLFLPLVMTLFWRRVSASAAFFGIAAGIMVGTPLSIYANVTGRTELVVTASVLGLLVPGVVTAALSYLRLSARS